ncbi:albusnodin/ikarugamycin family macrolactam cyclase [Streptomyces corynorhini]|uniref:Asparagine synthase n=1 Tax=Streptomyces corynorhini TaxID=2282652 RepID=A0A370B4W0_9ACTN|nr:albusnodin/ikarugamycin family macrolactam cyclase [Streptomyces corynorhini]RDG36877.1 asparagine synthase [Streptomyces corynorhini]
MRWYGGCAPDGPRIVPTGARVLWNDPLLWTMGNWSPRLVRTVESPDARLALFGSCSADMEELGRALAAADLAGAVEAWAGSFTVVRLRRENHGEGIVEVVTDAAGACPIYTVNAPDGVVWASSSRALSSLVGGKVDTIWLASYLWDKKAPVPGRSAWADVTPVPAGQRLVLGMNSLETEPWWSPVVRRYEEALPAVRLALTEGVHARVEGVRSSTDVAGIDSSTLAVIAARSGPIAGVTAHPSNVIEGGDLDYARSLTVPGLTGMLFPLDGRHLPFTPTEEPLPAADEPPPSAAVWAMLSAQLGKSAAIGAVCHLTGDGGDNLFLPAPTHLVDLARNRQWPRFVRDAFDWARLRRQSPAPVIRAALRGDTHGVARPWLSRPRWLAADVPDPVRPDCDADTWLVQSIRTVARAAHADTQLADSLGVELHNPYFDGAVLGAVVSVPSWQRFSARRYKPLLVDACGDMLPELHRRRVTKGLFVGDFHRGLRANLRCVLDRVDGRLSGLGIIDPVPLRESVHAAALGAETVWAALLPVLAAESWWEAVVSAPSITWDTRPRVERS